MTVVAEILSVPGLADPVSCLTHLIGAGVVLWLSFGLIRESHGFMGRTALAVFAFSAAFLLSMSGVFHLLPRDSSEREVMLRMDHAAIFALIAGTFTPIHILLFRGIARWGVLVPVWLAAIAGITLKTIFFNDIPYAVGLVMYVVMGWIGLSSMVMASRMHGVAFTRPLIVGGLAYTAGAAIELFRVPDLIPGVVGAHELFHVAVLLGLGSHWTFIRRCAERDLDHARLGVGHYSPASSDRGAVTARRRSMSSSGASRPGGE